MIARRFVRPLHVVLASVVMCLGVSVGLAQDRPLQPFIHGELLGTSPQSYTVRANAGDVLAGTIELKGTFGWFEVFTQAGAMIRNIELDLPEEMPVGFVAPTGGTYRIDIRATEPTGGSYVLRTRTRTPAALAGVPPAPTVRYESERIVQLARNVKAGLREAVARFWSEAAEGGGPIVERIDGDDDDVLVTFLWRETYETHNVVVVRPPYGPIDYRSMSHLSGTDVWYKTMKVRKGSRFTYNLSPNHLDEDDVATSHVDPLNPRIDPIDMDRRSAYAASLLELPGAPDESWFRRTPPRRGSVAPRTFESRLLNASLSLLMYTPPDWVAAAGPYPLVLLLDGPAYAMGTAPVTLDNLIADGRIRPPVVCFVSSATSTSPRAANFQNPRFAEAIATELVPWLQSSYAISAEPEDRVIGGRSAGAGTAGFTALRYPHVFGNVLSQSSGGRNLDFIVENPRVPVRFYLDVGIYEAGPWGSLPLDEIPSAETGLGINRRLRDVLRAKGYDVTYRETGGGHDAMHWRATLAEALMTLLGSPRE